MMQKLGGEPGEAIEHVDVQENAQRKVEGHNFDIRKIRWNTMTYLTISVR